MIINTNTMNNKNTINIRKKSLFISILTALILFLLILIPSVSYAKADDTKIYDGASLFTETEVVELETLFQAQSEEAKADIILITTKSIGNKSKKQYLEDYYDKEAPGYEGRFGSTVLLLLNMDPNDRGLEIQGYKEAKYYLNNDRIQNIITEIIPDLKADNYYTAVTKFSNLVVDYMNSEPYDYNNGYSNDSSHNYNGNHYDSNNKPEYVNNSRGKNDTSDFSVLKRVDVQIVISILIAGISVGIMVLNSGGSITTNDRTYLNHDKAYVTRKVDNYIKTTVTKVKKPDDNNNNSGFSGSDSSGTSSGGHSHSGGGSSF